MRTPAPSIATNATTPLVAETDNHRQLERAYAVPPVQLPSPVQRLDEQPISGKRHIRIDSHHPSNHMNPRGGVEPTSRNQLGEIQNLVDQSRNREMFQKKVLIEHWLDGTPLDTFEKMSLDSPPPEQQPAIRRSSSKDRDRTASNLSAPGEPSSRLSDNEDQKVEHQNEFDDFHRPRSPPNLFVPGPTVGALANRSPTLDAFPWLDPLRVSSSGNKIAQPATANQAIVHFAHRANSLETASHYAIEGDSHDVMNDRGARFPQAAPQPLPQQPGDLMRMNTAALKTGRTYNRASWKTSDINLYPASAQRFEQASKAALSNMDLSDSQKQAMLAQRTWPISRIAPPPILPNPGPANRDRATTNHAQSHPTSAEKRQTNQPRHAQRPSRASTETEFSLKPGSEFAYEACKKDIKNSNPRIQEYLLERMTQEQVRRYERLGQLKNNHTKLRQQGRCPSGPHCLDQEKYSHWLETAQGTPLPGLAQMQPSYPLNPIDRRDTDMSSDQNARLSPNEDSDGDFGETFVGPSSLPHGYPTPPNQSFPSEFECPLCFRHKKFSKPSDWVKHIHEDIQPFVCTFEKCGEPRSFKRKADWVRHENERHRQLEWWTCKMKECSHKCFRKDNFVQHLIREHKLPEPKTRSQESRSVSKDTAEDEVWKLVDTCRHETTRSPKDEPCGFCGNVCSSFKKLSVHIGKHLENTALPIWKRIGSSDQTSTLGTGPSSAPKSPEDAVKPIITYPTSPQESTEQAVVSASDTPRPGNAPLAPIPISVSSVAPHTSSNNRAYQCDFPGCAHERGFATQTDLNRHQKGVHGVYQSNDSVSYRCQGKDCNNGDKIWPRRDNFRGHLARIHPNEDIDELTERYITLNDIVPWCACLSIFCFRAVSKDLAA